MTQLEGSEGDMLLKQVRVCYQIGIECMDLDPKKRPTAQQIVRRLDKTTDNSDETNIASSLWGVLHMKENASNSSSMSTGLNELKYLDIFKKYAETWIGTTGLRLKSHIL
jgi:hypothetical protein